MRGPLLAFLLCLSGSGLAVAAATPQFRPVGVADGLPSTGTTALALDRDGYLWIGTGDGLARYDGVGYQIHQYVPGDSTALPGNSVQALFVDPDNRLWVGVEGHGLSVLDADRRGFRQLSRANQPLLLSDDVWAITATPDHSIWFGTYAGGLYRLDGRQRLHRYTPVAGNPHSLPAENVLALTVDTHGVLWVGTTQGLARWTAQGFAKIPANSLSGTVVFSLSAEDDGSLWIGTDQGLDHRLANGRIEKPAWRDQLPDPGVTSVLMDHDRTRWITTRRGLVSEHNGRIDTLESVAAAHVPILQGLADSEGGLWFATAGDGLLRLPQGWRNFTIFRRGDSAQSLSNQTVRGSALSRDGRVWLVGASGGLDLLDPASGRVEHRLQASALPDKRLSSVVERRDGSVWIGHQLGLSRYDPGTGALHHWRIGQGEQPLLPGVVNRLLETPDGLLWLASYGGGVQARDLDGRIVYSLTPNDGKGLLSPDQKQFALGPDGALWLAGPAGLLRWNDDRERLEKVRGAPVDAIYGMCLVPPDTVWLHRMGLLEAYRWNGESLSRFRQVSSDQGLPAVAAGGVSVDRSGVLWLTTTRGLLRYDPVGNRLRIFSVRDGLPSQEFQSWPPLMTAQGLGLAGSNAGLVVFDPARIRSSGSTPRLVVDTVSVRRGEDVIALSTDPSELSLAPDDRDLRVSVRLLSFADPKAHRYRFWLHGYDPDWVAVGAQGERVFSQLAPGRYRLQVRAANADGLWSNTQTLSFQVQAPWWQTGWAKLLWLLSAVLLLLLLASRYRAGLRRRHAENLRRQREPLAEQGSEAKTRFLATLGHEIRTPMTGVLGMAELLLIGPLEATQRSRVELIQRAGQHLLRLVNDALDLARIEAGKLTLRDAAFDVPALLEEVAAMLLPLATARGLTFSLQRGPGTPRVLRGDSDRVRQILLNLGNNAIKFTEHGEVAIRSAQMSPHGLVLEVSDTGPGLSQQQQARLFQRFEQADGARTAQRYGGSGLGLAICQELAAAMNGRIDVQSLPGQGATFRVVLPLMNAQIHELVDTPAVGKQLNTRSRRILLVEDDAMVAEVIVAMLQSSGHQVTHVTQGLAALTELQTERFDLAFLDLDLPGIDGIELARLIQTQGHTLPLIALTARADSDAEPQARAAGMQSFLRKPVTRAMLTEQIEQVLGTER